MKYMLDTDICIYVINHRVKSVLEMFRKNINEGIAISAITLSELEYGLAASKKHNDNRDLLSEFLSFIEVLSFDEAAAACYGPVCASLKRKGTPIGALDELIAAHALSAGLTLVTNNLREFGRVDGLNPENWVLQAEEQARGSHDEYCC